MHEIDPTHPRITDHARDAVVKDGEPMSLIAVPQASLDGIPEGEPGNRFKQGATVSELEILKSEMERALADEDVRAMQLLLYDLDVAREANQRKLAAANAAYDRTRQQLAEAKKAVDERNKNIPEGMRLISADVDSYLNGTGALFDEEDAKVYEQWVEARKKGFRDPFEARRRRVNWLLATFAVVGVVLLVIWLFG